MKFMTSISSTDRLGIRKLSIGELNDVQGGVLPSDNGNTLGYSVNRAPNGAVMGTINYERNLGNGYVAGADLTRQGGRTFGGIHFGGQAGSNGTWSAEATRFGNDTNFSIKGRWRF